MSSGGSVTGRKAYNNGTITKYFGVNDIIPEGFVPGMKPRDPEVTRLANEKRKKTCLDKYGYIAPSLNPDIKTKTEQTCIVRYGCKAPSQNPDIQKKAEQTCIEKYGYKSSAMAPEVKKKQEETNLKKYGHKSSAQASETKAKAAQTCIERYGAISPSMNAEVQQKKIETSRKHYGVDYPMQVSEVKEKSKQTCLDKYGVVSPSQSKKFQEKAKQTTLEKYGEEYYTRTVEYKERAKNTNLKKYGVENPMQDEGVKLKTKQTWYQNYGTDCPFKSPIIQAKVNNTCQEKYGYDWPCQLPQARKASKNNSQSNLKFKSFLNNLGIVYEQEFGISGYSYDFKVGNTLIEIDPTVTHNTVWSPFGSKHKSRITENYHKNKSKVAKEAGYKCIHIFDWDNPEKIVKEMLITKSKIYARNTSVYGIPKDEVKAFEEEHHLQGYCNGQSVCLGLRSKTGELVSLMTFGKPRYNKNYEWELLRYCSSYNIVGGTEKLFKYFITNYQPKSIISYCDNAKFTGNVYTKLGFTLQGVASPSKHWYSYKEKRHITDNLLRQRGYDQLFNESYGKGTSNEELMLKRWYLPVYDCGQSVYTW